MVHLPVDDFTRIYSLRLCYLIKIRVSKKKIRVSCNTIKY